MREQIVMQARDIAANAGRVTVRRSRRVILMTRDVERLGNQ